jgi:hypothetical protein
VRIVELETKNYELNIVNDSLQKMVSKFLLGDLDDESPSNEDEFYRLDI